MAGYGGPIMGSATYLRGRRPMPEGFEARVHATLDRLEAAERAAAETRKRVLAETVDVDGGGE